MKFDLMALVAQSAAKWGGVLKYDTSEEKGKRKRKDGDDSDGLGEKARKKKKNKLKQKPNGNNMKPSLAKLEDVDNVDIKPSKGLIEYTEQESEVDIFKGNLEMKTCSSPTDISPKLVHIKTETESYYPGDEVNEKLVGKPLSSGNVLNVHSHFPKVKGKPLAVKEECTDYKNKVINDENSHHVPELKFKGDSMKSVTIRSEVDECFVMKLLRKSEAKVLKAQEKFNHVKKEKESSNKQERRQAVTNEPGVDTISKQKNLVGVAIDQKVSELLNQNDRVCRQTTQKIKKNGKQRKISNLKMHVKQQYTEEEDNKILNAMETDGDKLKINDLADQLGRPVGSVYARVKKLKKGESSRNQKRLFSLEEDLLIMDSVLPALGKNLLKDLVLPFTGDLIQKLSTDLKRVKNPIYQRWRDVLQPWILQYYTGTLNLDIRRMLLNYMADTFGSREDIDWLLVAERPEFVGHTEFSLRRVFFTTLDIVKRHEKLRNLKFEDVTLSQLAEVSNECFNDKYSRRLSKRILRRQTEVIDYFKNYVDKHGITNFM